MTIEETVKLALAEDLGDGDHTSRATIPPDAKGKAELIARENGILAGINVAVEVFRQVDPEIKITKLKRDGNPLRTGDQIFLIEGRARSILSAERTALNFLQRMSGIATYTHKVVQKLEGLHTKLLDTRKTTPCNRTIEKLAVKIGGGHNHRFGLYDMIMIKDNHIDFAGGIQNAIMDTHSYLLENDKDLKIEIEVRNFQELREVTKLGGVHRIMLDNFTPDDLLTAVQIIDKKFETEASGGITIDNIREYAESGVDYISVGALTHQIKSLDMSLKAIK
ncbi:MAG TPA: carboxylating nicotinate-nucleotide diphosphorylase [Bacteroidetes bacterium]|nr:carboxylating nicotinate-nucleotide diphosphorylase [Bacteroidota bacterium]